MKKVWVLMVAAVLLLGSSDVLAKVDAELQAQIEALQSRISELEEQQSETRFQQRHGDLIRQMVEEASADYQAGADSAVTAGYDGNFFIKTTDDQFKLSINTRLQLRHYYGHSDDGDDNLLKNGTPAPDGDGVDSDSSSFELERARIYFKGHVMKDLNYYVALSMGDDAGDGGDVRLLDYNLSYAFAPEIGLMAGRFKGPFGKSENTSSGRQGMVDRSLANEIFNIGRVQGIEAFGDLAMGDGDGYYRVAVFSGFQTGNHDPSSETDNSPAVAGRLVFPLGGSSAKDFENESDLKYHENPVSQIGFSSAYSDDRDEAHYAGGKSDAYDFLAKSSVDGDTDIYKLGGEAVLFGLDYSYKYQGFSVNLEGFAQNVKVNESEVAFNNSFGDGRNSDDGDPKLVGKKINNYGWSAQSGVFVVPKEFELVSRISGVYVDGANDSYEYAGGWNWYFSGQDLKLSMDLSYIDKLPVVSSNPGYDGVQNQGLFLVRTQMQFQF